LHVNQEIMTSTHDLSGIYIEKTLFQLSFKLPF